MIDINKDQVKELLSIDDVFQLLLNWGGDPEYTEFGILSHTICHNPPGEGSKKLYFYSNSGLFKCYTGCPESYFDIFQLYIKIKKIQENKEVDLNDAVRYIAQYLGYYGVQLEDDGTDIQEDWRILKNYERIEKIEYNTKNIQLKEYNKEILKHFPTQIIVADWEREGIARDIIRKAGIGYYPVTNQLTIPHYDINDRFIGLRGRALSGEDAERYGKYRPLRLGNQQFNHPLGMNLYNLNNSKSQISKLQKAIVFEGEKSVYHYQTFFGNDNDISVACCGSNLSAYQTQLLLNCGAKEIIIAFDRQFQEIGDEEYKHLTNNLLSLNKKYKNDALISFIFDKDMITSYKAAPVDEGKEKFLTLFKNRIII